MRRPMRQLKAVAAALAAGLTLGALTTAISQPIPIRTSLNLTSYGAANNAYAGKALQIALNDCAALGVPVYVPAGVYWINAAAAAQWPTQNNNCPGIFGDGPGSIFAPVDYNGPVITANVITGVPQSGKYIHDLAVQPSWSSSNTTTMPRDKSRLLSITGASDGWAYSIFANLSGYAVQDVVHFETPAIVTGPYIQSNSGWNQFIAFRGYPGVAGTGGSQAVVYPVNLVSYTGQCTPYSSTCTGGSTSTGNTWTNFIGSTSDAWLYASGGANTGGQLFMTGDIVVNGGQLAGGRVLHVGASGGVCPGYFRTIDISNVQVDAGSTETVLADCGVINNAKISGNMGGSAPWAGVNYLARSTVNDLGAAEWKTGGPLNINGTGTHTIGLWLLTLGPGGTRVDVAVAGTVGGVDSGVAGATFECAYNGSSGNANCRQIGIGSATTASGTVSANFPTFSWSSSGAQVTLSTTFTDTLASKLDGFAFSHFGSVKIQRLSPAGSVTPANAGSEGIVY